MTKPRYILAEKTYLITRRTSHRHFLLKPSKRTNQLFSYCLAIAARRYGIVLHAFLVMSDHYHLILFDPFGLLPDFMRYLNSLLSRALNRQLDRSENLWAPGSYSKVALLEIQDLIDKTAYTFANPVTAGLVRYAHQWEGATSLAMPFGHSQSIQRPNFFFRDSMPTNVDLAIQPPRFASTISPVDVWQDIQHQLRERQTDTAALMRQQNRRFLGMDRVYKLRHTDSPKTRPQKTNIKPTVASRNTPLRIAYLLEKKAFYDAYYAMRDKLKTSRHKLVFPLGTYRLVARGIVSALAG